MNQNQQKSLNRIAFGAALLLDLCEFQLADWSQKRSDKSHDFFSTLKGMKAIGYAIQSIEKAYVEMNEPKEDEKEIGPRGEKTEI